MTVIWEATPAARHDGDAPAPAAVNKEPPSWWVRNRTPRPIWIEHHGRVFLLAPFEERTWRATPAEPPHARDPRDAFPDLRVLEDRHQVEIVRHRAGRGGDGVLSTLVRTTLTELEGIDHYERTRLSEEGITSVEALAHHDLLELFFKTRVPAARLVDWVDQAILAMYLRTGETSRGLREALCPAGRPPPSTAG